MPTDEASARDQQPADQAASPRSDVAVYGPDIPTEAELRLLGDVKGRRILDLGCGAAQAAIAFAKAGAIATGVDLSAAQLAVARQRCEEEEVRVELRHGDLADLAFLRADSIDGAFAANAFDYVEDLGRVFRQVHRVLKVGAPLAFSVRHPFWGLSEGIRAGGSPSYFDRSAVDEPHGEGTVATYPRTFSDLYTALVRASYRVDAFVEPEPMPHAPRSSTWQPAMASVPFTLVVKARKEGS